MTVTENPFLTGNYGPVDKEVTATDLVVDGTHPGRAAGALPAHRTEPVPHAGRSVPLVHRRRDDARRRARCGPRALVPQPLGPHRRDRAPRWASSRSRARHRRCTTRATRTCSAMPGRILSLTEGAMPYELSRELDTLRRTDFGGPLPSGFTAHPKIDPVTGELHGFSYWFSEPYLIYHLIDAAGRLVRSEPITLPRSVMMHDFAITRSHVLFFDLPVVFDLAVQPFPFRWDDDAAARIGVMPRDGGDADVEWFDIDPCYVFHPMNAYDEDDTVVVDVPRHPTMFATEGELVEGPNRGGPPALHRWTIDLAAGKVRDELVDERGQEFPRVNETLLGVEASVRLQRRGRDRGRVRRRGLPQARLRPRHERGARLRHRRARRASSSSCPRRTARARTTAGSWASSTTRRPIAATTSSSTPTTSPRHPWRPCTSRNGCRSVSTATGSPTHKGSAWLVRRMSSSWVAELVARRSHSRSRGRASMSACWRRAPSSRIAFGARACRPGA